MHLPPLAERFPPSCLSAYSLVLAAERRAEAQLDKASYAAEWKYKVMDARVVGFFLVELHSESMRATLGDTPTAHIIREVTSMARDNDEAVYALGLQYREVFMRAFHSKGPIPPPSSSSSDVSRPSFDTIEDMTNDCLEPAPADSYWTCKRRALARDSFRCMLTGAYDEQSCLENAQLAARADVSREGSSYTQCCYILKEAGLDSTSTEPKMARVLTMLSHFGLGDQFSALTGGIHHLSNVLTLGTAMQRYMDDFGAWLEPTGEDHCYRVCFRRASSAKQFHTLRSPVRFEANPMVASRGLPLPDARLITLHATCAKVAHMSGAAEHWDAVERSVETTDVLAEDGSSVLLGDLLQQIA